MGSLIFYLLLTGVLMYLCKGTSNSVNRKRSILVAYTIFFIVAAIRYGIGNDYAGYAPSCIYAARYFSMGASLKQGLMAFSEDMEMAHIFFCWLVQWMKYPFVGLYFIYSLLQVGLLYLILKLCAGIFINTAIITNCNAPVHVDIPYKAKCHLYASRLFAEVLKSKPMGVDRFFRCRNCHVRFWCFTTVSGASRPVFRLS